MIPAIELATEAKHKVFIYFPPHQYSSNLAAMGAGKPIQMKQYETRFKQSMLPDVVHLNKAKFSNYRFGFNTHKTKIFIRVASKHHLIYKL